MTREIYIFTCITGEEEHHFSDVASSGDAPEGLNNQPTDVGSEMVGGKELVCVPLKMMQFLEQRGEVLGGAHRLTQ